MSRAEDVPRAHKRRLHSTVPDERLTFRAHRDERLHHRSRLRDAEINEVPNAGVARAFHRDLDGWQINGAKLRGLRRARMRDTDQMNEGVAAADRFRVRTVLQRIG